MLARAEGSIRVVLLLALLSVAGAGAGVYLYQSRSGGNPRETMNPSRGPASSGASSREAVAGSSMRHPLPDAASSAVEALPPLDQSDESVWATLADLFGEGSMPRFLVRDALIERFVATVDNLPESKLAIELRPIAPVEGRLYVTLQKGETPSYLLTELNYERYEPVLRTLRLVSAERLVRAYVDYYPLLQEAYERLGYPDRYFNDRMIDVIDHLLETPEVSGPIELVRPSVYYKFSDPALEERSAGQKVLIRMGPRNAALVKARLREIRERLAHAVPPDDVEARVVQER